MDKSVEVPGSSVVDCGRVAEVAERRHDGPKRLRLQFAGSHAHSSSEQVGRATRFRDTGCFLQEQSHARGFFFSTCGSICRSISRGRHNGGHSGSCLSHLCSRIQEGTPSSPEPCHSTRCTMMAKHIKLAATSAGAHGQRKRWSLLHNRRRKG